MQKIASLMLMVVIAVSSITAFVSSFALHDHYHRKLLVGSVGLVASVGMYGSPLVAVVSSLMNSFLNVYFFNFKEN